MLNRQFKLTPRFLSAAARATSNVLIRSKVDNVQIRSLSLSPELLVTGFILIFYPLSTFLKENNHQSQSVKYSSQIFHIYILLKLSLYPKLETKNPIKSAHCWVSTICRFNQWGWYCMVKRSRRCCYTWRDCWRSRNWQDFSPGQRTGRWNRH